jgi:hypothetical protein
MISLSPLIASILVVGPPFITDDPQPVDYRHWEVYIASQSFHQFGQYNGTLPHIEVNYGATPNLQLHVIAPMAYFAASGMPTQYGYGDTEVGTKLRLVDETKTRPMIGIFPLIEIPTGSASRSLGSGQYSEFIPLWLQKVFGIWTVYGGGGFWHNPGVGNRDYWFNGITVQIQTTKKLMLGGEIFHTTPQVSGVGDTTAFNVGGQYDFDDGHHLMFSIGTGLHGPDHGTMYAAYQWTYGPADKKS